MDGVARKFVFRYMSMVPFEEFGRFFQLRPGGGLARDGADSPHPRQRAFRREVYELAGGAGLSGGEEVDERFLCHRDPYSRHRCLGAVRRFGVASEQQRPGLHLGDAIAQHLVSSSRWRPRVERRGRHRCRL